MTPLLPVRTSIELDRRPERRDRDDLRPQNGAVIPVDVDVDVGLNVDVDIDAVASQLAPQLAGSNGTLVLIPTVGFGEQSHRALPRTMQTLAAQAPASPLTVVLLVNRPRHREDDGTQALIERLAAGLPQGGTRFAVASTVIDGRPQLGRLRQLAHDAAVACLGGASRVPLSITADDDFVHAPQGFADRLAAPLQAAPDAGVAIGPVLFDDPQLPSIQFVDFFVADVVRALLAARWSARLVAGDLPGDPWKQYAESIALSGNLALRTAALDRAGGYPPLNEITGVVQAMDRGAAPGSAGVAVSWGFDETRSDVLESLVRNAVRISSRRALRAFLDHGVPPVGQWRACRFHASRIDPARSPQTRALPAAFRRDDPDSMTRLRESTARLLSITLASFPPDVPTARAVLAAVGLDAGTCRIELDPGNDRAPWQVHITDARPMLDRIDRIRSAWLAGSATHTPMMRADAS